MKNFDITSSKSGYNSISFIIPAFNCIETVAESVNSIVNGNYCSGDEIVIVNDCSTDSTEIILQELKRKYPFIILLNHPRNKGGASARNTAVENASNSLIFCLDSDNILVPGSVFRLKEYLLTHCADVASFQELHYFKNSFAEVTHKWFFREGEVSLADCLAGHVFPGASGNYLYTKQSWLLAGGYPEFAGALDAWGFGFRQLAIGAKMIVMPDSYYYHRYGHESYWVRDSRKVNMSLTALQIMLPFIELLNDYDVNYIMGRRGRRIWFDRLDSRPLKTKLWAVGKAGMVLDMTGEPIPARGLNIFYRFARLLFRKIFL